MKPRSSRTSERSLLIGQRRAVQLVSYPVMAAEEPRWPEHQAYYERNSTDDMYHCARPGWKLPQREPAA